ncbi:MAG: MarR family transcriptional regulator [Acidimicrobiales bacterium]|nr:MarR family transcriptional regulator [Acidimicrobiales bacterium]
MTDPTHTPRDPAVDDATASRLRLAVLRLARRLRQESPPGITPSQLSALASIDHLGPVAIGDLAAHENVQPPTISRIVGTLEGDGWVERIGDENDRRIALVRATPKARRELARIRRDRNAYLARRLAHLSPDELDAVLTALPALERLLQEDPR